MGSQARAKALNVAEWIDVSVRALGFASQFQRVVWWRSPGAPSIYPAALILGAPEPPEDVSAPLAEVLATWGSSRFSLWDVGGELDLSPLGLRHLWTRPWLVRPPSPRVGKPSRAIEFSRVKDGPGLHAYEQASKAGFEAEDDVEPWHASSTLQDERISYLLGRVEDAVVVSGVAFRSAEMVGIYGISTPPRFRRLGYARALVEHITRTHDRSSLGVWPDPVSVAIYRDAGFSIGGEIAAWIRG